MALPLLAPLIAKGLAVAGAGAGGAATGYGLSKIIPDDNPVTRWWNRDEVKKLRKQAQRAEQGVEARRRKQMSMFEDMGVDTDGLVDKNGEVDSEKLEAAFAQARQKIKERGGRDLPEDASLTDLYKAYRASDPARNPPASNPPASKSNPEVPVDGGPKNGEQQKKAETPSLTPRSRAQVSTQTRGARASNSGTGTVLNGAEVDAGDTATVNQVKEAQKNAAQNDAILAAEARRDTQTWASSNPRRREQQRLNDQLALDKGLDRYKAAREARIAANYQKRANARYESGKLSNEDDWKNLGREGSNWRDADKRAEAIKALQARMTKMADTTSVDEKGNYTNTFYANDPKRQRDLAALRKLVDKGIADGTVTDKQLDAVTKKLDMWQQGADARASRVAKMQEMRDAEKVRGLRQQYGMTDATAFSDADVRDYHEAQQKNARTEVLRGMQVAPGITSSGKPVENVAAAENMQKFADGWQRLLAAGFDPQKTFQTAMQNADNKKAYMEGLGTIAQDDPDRADKMDQLRRRFIMNQAMQDHGIKFIGGQEGIPGGQLSTHDIIRDENGEVIGTMDSGQTLGQAMAANLPGRSILSNGRGGNAVVDTADREVAKAEAAAAAPPAPGLTPRKKDETQQAAKGGDALRPRRRR